MAISVGDLVQFKLEHANRKRVWHALPDAMNSYGFQSADYLFVRGYGVPFSRYVETMEWKPTQKIGMIVQGFQNVCFTKSKLPALRAAATKRFAKLMIFSNNPTEAPMVVWALAEELEQYNDKPYLEILKARLREAVAQKGS